MYKLFLRVLFSTAAALMVPGVSIDVQPTTQQSNGATITASLGHATPRGVQSDTMWSGMFPLFDDKRRSSWVAGDGAHFQADGEKRNQGFGGYVRVAIDRRLVTFPLFRPCYHVFSHVHVNILASDARVCVRACKNFMSTNIELPALA